VFSLFFLFFLSLFLDSHPTIHGEEHVDRTLSLLIKSSIAHGEESIDRTPGHLIKSIYVRQKEVIKPKVLHRGLILYFGQYSFKEEN
jgi:hypothetical protein